MRFLKFQIRVYRKLQKTRAALRAQRLTIVTTEGNKIPRLVSGETTESFSGYTKLGTI